MKPRVLISTGHWRIVQTGRRRNVLEQRTGTDAMGRVSWREVPHSELGESWGVVDAIGDALQRRNELARKARRRRS